MRRLFVAGLTLAALLAGAVPADAAITRAQSIKIMKRAVRGEFVKEEQKVYGKSGPLAAGSVVTQGGIPNRLVRRARKTEDGLRGKVPAVKLKRPAWFFWHDQNPQAGFEKPGQIILVDAVNGRVRKLRISWWPVINRQRVFPPGVQRPRAAAPTPPAAWGAALVPALRNDCIVAIGDRTDPYFTKSLARITRMGNSIGAKVYPVARVRDLERTIDAAARADPPCVDVMIFIAGHGWAPLGSDVKTQDGLPVATSEKARVTIKSTVGGGAKPTVAEENLDFDDVKRIIHARPNLTFKLVVDSCFSGRWTLMMAEPNVRITVASTRQSQVTFLAVTDPRMGTQSGGKLDFQGGEVGAPDGPDKATPFAEWFAGRVEEWSDKPEEVEKGADLGEAAGYAGQHKDGNRAEDLGWQQTQVDDRTDQRPHAPPPGTTPPAQPPGQVGYEVSDAGTYRHIGPGDSEVCWDVQTTPPRPNAEVTVSSTGPAIVSGAEQSVRTNDSGFVRVRVKINDFGTYRSDANVVASDGAARSAKGEVEVKSQQGTCPPP